MTDDTKRTGYETGTPGDESLAWTEPEAKGNDAGAKAREWLSQLQTIIDNLATQAGPVVKEVGAKAAELAALAGEKAGPVAQKAAELTGQAGQKLAVKGRDLATELRRDVAASKLGDVTDSASDAASDVADAASETADDIADSTSEPTWKEPTTTGAA